MKSIGWLGLFAVVLVSGCATGGDETPAAETPAVAAAIDADGGRWKLVSCHIDQRGCRDEDIFRSEDGCEKAGRDLERADKERRAACRRLSD